MSVSIEYLLRSIAFNPLDAGCGLDAAGRGEIYKNLLGPEVHELSTVIETPLSSAKA